MKLTKQEVLDLHNGLHDVGDLGGAKFAYAVAKNINRLKGEIEALKKAHDPKEGFLLYDEQRIELAEKHAVKVDGKPKTTTNNKGIEEYVIEDMAIFNKELKALQIFHKEAIEEREKQLNDFNEILKEEVDIDIYTISSKHIPEEIKAKEMTAILPIIEEDLE